MIKYDKDYIEKSIKEGKSWEELGREYNVTGAAIKKFAKRNGIEFSKRRKINPNETFNKGIKLKEEKILSEEEKELIKEKRRARKHNLILKKKYKDLNIPKVNPGCCPICGKYHCTNKFCKSHNFQGLIGLIRLGLDSTKIGTSEIFNEISKVKNTIYDLYWNQGLSLIDLKDKFNMGSEHFPTHVLNFLEIKRRTLTESQVNAIKQGKSINIPQNFSFKSGKHITWDNKEVYLRSSYEFDYAEKLDSLKITYEVESIRLSYFNKSKNREAIAIPDFYIPSTNTIVEIKSDYTLDINEMIDKFNAYISFGYNPILILEKEEIDLFNIENLVTPERYKRIKESNIH
jgi:hypothetical protein